MSPLTFSILSLFPEAIFPYTQASLIGKACQQGLLSVKVINPRDFTDNPHGKVDDIPYGGGSGMVLTCQPVETALQSLMPLEEPTRILLTSPAGKRFDQAYAKDLATAKQVVILCGHYEGFDERIIEMFPMIEEVSVGDYVLTGGELPALTILDAVSRMVPGVVQRFESVEADSFYHGLLDYPHYTRPADYKGFKVPDVLLSGNHQAIAHWRKEQALQRTQARRPDLLNLG